MYTYIAMHFFWMYNVPMNLWESILLFFLNFLYLILYPNFFLLFQISILSFFFIILNGLNFTLLFRLFFIIERIHSHRFANWKNLLQSTNKKWNRTPSQTDRIIGHLYIAPQPCKISHRFTKLISIAKGTFLVQCLYIL
jgi:hypothetical protein